MEKGGRREVQHPPREEDCLVFPVTLGHTSTCRSAALALSALIHFVAKHFPPLFHSLAPFICILSCDNLLVGLDDESFEIIQKVPDPLFFLPLMETSHPHEFYEHHVFSSVVSSIRASNTAKRICLFRNITSMFSILVFTRVSR